MIYFFDTSALVKRYHEEKGTKFVDGVFEELVNTKKEAFISSLSLLEITSAFKRKQKGNIITQDEFQNALKTSFEEIKEKLTIVPVTEETINESIMNVTEYALKPLKKEVSGGSIQKKKSNEFIVRNCQVPPSFRIF